MKFSFIQDCSIIRLRCTLQQPIGTHRLGLNLLVLLPCRNSAALRPSGCWESNMESKSECRNDTYHSTALSEVSITITSVLAALIQLITVCVCLRVRVLFNSPRPVPTTTVAAKATAIPDFLNLNQISILNH